MSGPHPDPLDPVQALEPAAVAAYGAATPLCVNLSHAISAKRTADALEQIAAALGGDHFHTIDNMLFQFGQTFGRGLEIGARK